MMKKKHTRSKEYELHGRSTSLWPNLEPLSRTPPKGYRFSGVVEEYPLHKLSSYVHMGGELLYKSTSPLNPSRLTQPIVLSDSNSIVDGVHRVLGIIKWAKKHGLNLNDVKIPVVRQEWGKPSPGLEGRVGIFILALMGGIALSVSSLTATGNAISNLTGTTPGLLGIILFVAGLAGMFFYFRTR